MHREPKSSPSCSKGRPDHQSLNELIYLHVLRKFKLGQRHIQECERRYIGLGLLMISKVKTKLLQVFMWAFPTLCSEFLAHSFGFPSTVLPAVYQMVIVTIMHYRRTQTSKTMSSVQFTIHSLSTSLLKQCTSQ